METQLEEIIIYSLAFLLCLVVVLLYLRKQRKGSRQVKQKIQKAKELGLYEPVSLHPVVDPKSCIRTGACIAACPEKDILGIVDGKATTINASRCVGHGACFHACPTEAITLCIGTETRGVDLPHVNEYFESNVRGIYIAGELGGMGLIKNAVEQGRQAVENIVHSLEKNHGGDYDLVIIGAGPAGISGALTAQKNRLRFLVLEQDTLGGTVFTFPRSKVVMTSAMELPLYGKLRLFETSKSELLEIWNKVLLENNIQIRENTRVSSIREAGGFFEVESAEGEKITAARILLAIGRRGSPRKLGVPGENLEKVAYRLLEPEEIDGKEIVVVGGGDSAIESALLLADRNNVLLSYRKEAFSRIKPANHEKVMKAMEEGKIKVLFNTNLAAIDDREVTIEKENGEKMKVENDLVYIFAGGVLPVDFLKKAGIEITRKFGDAILKHK